MTYSRRCPELLRCGLIARRFLHLLRRQKDDSCVAYRGRMRKLTSAVDRTRWVKKTRHSTPVRKKVAHTRLPSVGYRGWSRFLAVSLQVTWVINPAVDGHYFPPGPLLPSQPLRGLLAISLLGEQRHNRCKQFAYYCYPTASQLRFEPGPFSAWVQHGKKQHIILLSVTSPNVNRFSKFFHC